MSTSVGEAIVGVILAGGMASRMGGGDKPLLTLAGRPMLDSVLERLAPQCSRMVLSANGDPARFANYGLPVVADPVTGSVGPLAGILAGMDWAARELPAAEFIATVPGDCPFLPRDLVSRLSEARRAPGADIALAASGGRTHNVVGLWPVALRDHLRQAIVAERLRKVALWTSRYRTVSVPWVEGPIDPFLNVNTPGDLEEAERLARMLES